LLLRQKSVTEDGGEYVL